jgi:protein-disulfide isomerase
LDTGKVQWVVINASNEDGDRTSPVFLAAQAALQGGHYWDLADQLYDAGVRSPAYFAQLIQGKEASQGRPLAEVLDDPSVRAGVAADYSDYKAMRIRGTPTFLLRKQQPDGRWTRGILEDTQPLDFFQRVLDGLLREGGA